jgi:hypothetical protein
MGCSTGHTTDFVQILKPAKKKINLIKAAILFYILPLPNSIAPRTIEYHSPCVPRRSRILSYPPPSIKHKFGWLLRAVVDWRPPKATTNFVILIFCPEFRWPKRLNSILPYRRRPAHHLSVLYCNVTAAFWLVVVYSHPANAIEI